jgi:choline-glycine betaine transporter
LNTSDWLDIVWGILLVILAIKYLPVLGIFAVLTFAMAGAKIATLPFLKQDKV